MAPKDILDKLTILSQLYYSQDRGDTRWQAMKLQAYLASRKVTAKAMEERYAYVYRQAIKAKLEEHAAQVTTLPVEEDEDRTQVKIA